MDPKGKACILIWGTLGSCRCCRMQQQVPEVPLCNVFLTSKEWSFPSFQPAAEQHWDALALGVLQMQALLQSCWLAGSHAAAAAAAAAAFIAIISSLVDSLCICL